VDKLKISRHADELVVYATARRHNAEIFNLSPQPEGIPQIYTHNFVACRNIAKAMISSSLLVLNKICRYRVGDYYENRVLLPASGRACNLLAPARNQAAGAPGSAARKNMADIYIQNLKPTMLAD